MTSSLPSDSGNTPDRTSLAERVHELRPTLIGYLLRHNFCGPQDAEEIVGDLIVKILSRSDSAEALRTADAFFYTSVKNAALNRLRGDIRRKRALAGKTPGLFPDTLEDMATQVELAEERTHISSQLRAALASLTSPHKEILELQLEGLSCMEIVARLNVPLGTVMSRLSRAKTRLKEVLSSPNLGSSAQED